MQNNAITPQNYKSVWMQQSGNLLAADLISTAVEGAVIANIDKFDRTFPTVSGAIKGALSVPIYYFQRPIEKALSFTKNIEGEEYFNKRLAMSETERLNSLTQAAYHYGTAVGVGWASMIGSSKAIGKLTGTSSPHANMFAKDMLIHSVLIGVISLPQLSGVTAKMKDVVKCVAKTFGADEHKAEDLGRIAIFSGVPNYLTLAGVSTLMYRDNKSKAFKNLQSLHEQLSDATHLSH